MLLRQGVSSFIYRLALRRKFQSRVVRLCFNTKPKQQNKYFLCMLHGRILTKPYNNRISRIKLKTSNCQAWSFNIKTGICQIIEKISNEDFIGKN